jgi:hypothetical protein
MAPRIFVSIASYRDTECQWTVKSLFERARHPERVFAGICWQFIAEEDADCFTVRTRPDQCRVIEVDARQSRGVCWARSRIQRELRAGEEYFLQIDAHSRFVQDWDEIFLEMLAACGTPRAVLSAYPASYTPPDQLGQDVVTIISAKEFDDRGLLAFGSHGTPLAKAPDKPVPTPFIGAGLLFGPSDMVREVPYDPYIYFTGEEITLAARLWTSGWDIFAPNRVTVYHEYSERPNKRRHWHDHKLWSELSDRAVHRVRHLLDGEATKDAEALRDIDQYGLGSRRSFADYQTFAGVDFRRKLIGGKSPDEIIAALPPADRSKRAKARFTEIWRTNAWGSAETRSGPGSTLAQTEHLRARLKDALGRLDIQVLVDAGCGDLNWASKLSEGLRLYLGFDIVDEIVAGLRQKFSERKNHFFNAADVAHHVLPAADAILCRDVLTHLPHAIVADALANFRKSGSRYLIATTFSRGRNDPVRLGGWQALDLCAAPFNLPTPRLLIPEGPVVAGKSLGVWALDSV